MKFILGRKLGMTRVFDAEGKSIAVSMIKALPCFVSMVKTVEKDGYSALQIKATEKTGEKEKTVRSCEFKAEGEYKKGDKITLEQFEIGDQATVTGTSKGKGFAGTIKRHGFHRGPETHGGNNVREPGSIGAQQPQRVVPGRKMAGHMGHETITVKNLKVVDIDKDIILVAGAIPGPRKGIVKVYSENKSKSEVAE
jgi:large subunit ribosomal protein L3